MAWEGSKGGVPGDQQGGAGDGGAERQHEGAAQGYGRGSRRGPGQGIRQGGSRGAETHASRDCVDSGVQEEWV